MNRRKIAMKGKNQGPNSKDEKVITLFETDIHIVAYRGNVCNQKGPLWGSLDHRKIACKNSRKKSRDKKVISF